MALVNLLTYTLTFRTYHIAQAPGSKPQEVTRTVVPRLPTIQDLGLPVLDRMTWKVYAPNGLTDILGDLSQGRRLARCKQLRLLTRQQNGKVTISISGKPKRSSAPIPLRYLATQQPSGQHEQRKRNRATISSGGKTIYPCLTVTWPPIVSKLPVSFAPSLSNLQSIRPTPQNGKRWSWSSMAPPSALQ
jgi:hypothetical protein